jgi:hypothetical protein
VAEEFLSESIRSASEEWDDATTPFPKSEWRRGKEFIDPFRKYGNAIAWIEWNGMCTIIKIESLVQKQRAGTALLTKLKEICDKHELRMFGNATAYQPSDCRDLSAVLTQSELVGWYQRNGFVVSYQEASDVTEIWYPDIPNLPKETTV